MSIIQSLDAIWYFYFRNKTSAATAAIIPTKISVFLSELLAITLLIM
jgi:hypothetical protein